MKASHIKASYIFALAIILIILMGVLFYYTDSNFHIIVKPYSITYINQPNGGYILKLNVTAVNNGILPMNTNVTIQLGDQIIVGSSKFGTLREFTNYTSISIGPFSKKTYILTYYLPLTSEYFSNLYIEANGYYNYKLSNTSTTQLMDQIENLMRKSAQASNILPSILNLSTNLNLKVSGVSLFQIYPVIITAYPNGSISFQLYLFLYPNILKIINGTYNITVSVNNNRVYSSIIPIPYNNPYSNYIPIYLLNTPPLLAGNITYHTVITIRNTVSMYYASFNIVVSTHVTTPKSISNVSIMSS